MSFWILPSVDQEADLTFCILKLSGIFSCRETVVRVALLDLLDLLVLPEPLELLAPLERLVTVARP